MERNDPMQTKMRFALLLTFIMHTFAVLPPGNDFFAFAHSCSLCFGAKQLALIADWWGSIKRL
jgi:hypothetical protein